MSRRGSAKLEPRQRNQINLSMNYHLSKLGLRETGKLCIYYSQLSFSLNINSGSFLCHSIQSVCQHTNTCYILKHYLFYSWHSSQSEIILLLHVTAYTFLVCFSFFTTGKQALGGQVLTGFIQALFYMVASSHRQLVKFK